VVSARDEIIPPTEHQLLASALPRVRLKEFDDVHGSPAHLGALRKWLITSLLRARVTTRERRATPDRRPPARANGTGAEGSSLRSDAPARPGTAAGAPFAASATGTTTPAAPGPSGYADAVPRRPQPTPAE
jgi:hypothetical protein